MALRRGFAATLVMAACLALGACGGGGEGAPASTAKTTQFSLDDPGVKQAEAARKAASKRAAARTVATTPPPPTPAPDAAPAGPRRPHIVQRPIPFPATRRQEMAAYSERHYGEATAALTDPKVIVEHFTETPDFSSTFNTFAPDTPDGELGELPNVCAHFVVDTDGTISQLVPLRLRCRHTVGLNWTAVGIEQVGSSDAEILGRPAQMRSILRLTRWLQCRYGIATKDVIGHNESLTSPYHRENVASLRTQTHDDWKKADMDVVRGKLGSPDCG